MEIRKGLIAAAALLGVLSLTGCSQDAGVTTTAEPTATVDPFYVDVQVPYVTQVPEATALTSDENDDRYISISPNGEVTVLKDGWDELETAADSIGNYYTQLREGDTGDDVLKLQNRLKELGYYSAEPNGTFDAATTESVKLFEAKYSDQSFGIATVRLQQLLYGDTAVPEGEEDTGVQPDAYVELRFGDTGDNVSWLQTRLQELGYFAGDINGSYDYYTACAVMRFEAAYKRELTGVATVSMQEYLYADEARVMGSKQDKSSAGCFIAMAKGDSGADVLLLQQRLAELGYADATPNGEYNSFTVNLIKQFQENCGLKATGKASEETLESLYAADAPRAAEE